MPDDGTPTPYIAQELRDRGLIGPDDFICIAQDIPPNEAVPPID